MELNLPTGIPIVYELNQELKPTKPMRFLGDEETVRKAMEAVAAQGRRSESGRGNKVTSAQPRSVWPGLVCPGQQDLLGPGLQLSPSHHVEAKPSTHPRLLGMNPDLAHSL